MKLYIFHVALVMGAASPAAFAAPTAAKPYNRQEAKQLYRRPDSIPFPKANLYSPEREALGRTLFFDPRLSRSGIVSCGSCHNPSFSWGDGLPLAVGENMKQLGRRTPTIFNAAWLELLFWDGRAESLEEQALGPIQSPGEMNMPITAVLERIGDIPEYRVSFQSLPGRIAVGPSDRQSHCHLRTNRGQWKHALRSLDLRRGARCFRRSEARL
jgi:cytochrome c peroxidase